MASQKKERVFNTVKEVFETYMPAYSYLSFDRDESQSSVGQQLATQLVKDFQRSFSKKVKG